MPKYTITITKTAQKQLDKLPDEIAAPLFTAIAGLADNPRPYGYKNSRVETVTGYGKVTIE